MALRPRRFLRRREEEEPQPAREEANNVYARLPLLPEELQENVLAGLPLPQLASLLPRLSKSWQTRMFAKSGCPESKARCRAFRKLLDEKHPKMFAIVGMERRFQLKVAAFDFASGEWYHRVLGHLLDDTDEHQSLKSGYVNQACFAHDAGLLCFVFSRPRKRRTRPPRRVQSGHGPVVVCNPLTNEWKALPLQEYNQRMAPVLVQLAVDETTGHYKVTVVYKHRRYYAAELYDSTTKLWRRKRDGILYGQELYYSQLYARHFKCDFIDWSDRERLSHIASLCSEQSEANFVTARDGKQRMFKLKQEPGEDTYRISESAMEYGVDPEDFSVVTSVRDVASYKSSLSVVTSGLNDVYLMDTGRLLLLAVDQYASEERVHRQQAMRVRDQETGDWHDIPAPPREFKIPSKSKYFMCELRWNAFP